MIESDLVLKEQLGALVPEHDEPIEWDDVLQRAAAIRREPSRRRPLALAAIALAVLGLALSPVGAAVADELGSFSAWIRGEPGTPASPAEQEEFQRANQRTWVSFAPDTKLRRLLETEVSGTRFVLYGFRSGDDLCLRLLVRGAVSRASTHCAPLHALQTARTPAVVVATDESFGTTGAAPNDEGFVPSAYTATFGIASDGVKAVVLDADDGRHEALVGGNAFLLVGDHPKLGTRVRSAEAIAADGSRVALGLQSSPFGFFDLPAPPKGAPHGPSRVERDVEGGTIAWVERLEPRGAPLSKAQLKAFRPRLAGGVEGHVLLARAIQPDPKDYVRVAIFAVSRSDAVSAPGSEICVEAIDRRSAGGGCSQVESLFERWPFTWSMSNSGGQYSLLAGIASDDVARLELFLANGSSITVPLRDNAYLVRVGSSDFPTRLVAYDREGRVIGIDTQLSDGMTSRAAREAQTSVRRLARAVGAHGETAVLRAGESAGGYRCWTIEISHRGGGGGCTPWPQPGPALQTIEGTATHGDVFLTGALQPSVASLSLSFAGGASVRVEPISSFLVYAVPERFVRTDGVFVTLRAYDANGKQLDQRGVEVRR